MASSPIFNRILYKLFGSRNERLIKTYRKRVEAINSFEAETRKLSDAQLREKTAQWRKKFDDMNNDAERDATCVTG